jgi:hypothetical protein
MERMDEKFGQMASARLAVDPNVDHPLPSERLDGLHAMLAEAIVEYEKAKELQF